MLGLTTTGGSTDMDIVVVGVVVVDVVGFFTCNPLGKSAQDSLS
jgi:hypothetical protein